MDKRFYLIKAGETAHGPYSKSEAHIRRAAEPTAKIITAAQLATLKRRPAALK